VWHLVTSMGLFGNMGGVIGNSGSVFMVIVLGVADHLWGENVFHCPCGEYRVLYTSAYLVVPPLVIILIGKSKRVVMWISCNVLSLLWGWAFAERSERCASVP
jgi:hypothetical protein